MTLFSTHRGILYSSCPLYFPSFFESFLYSVTFRKFRTLNTSHSAIYTLLALLSSSHFLPFTPQPGTEFTLQLVICKNIWLYILSLLARPSHQAFQRRLESRAMFITSHVVVAGNNMQSFERKDGEKNEINNVGNSGKRKS